MLVFTGTRIIKYDEGLGEYLLRAEEMIEQAEDMSCSDILDSTPSSGKKNTGSRSEAAVNNPDNRKRKEEKLLLDNRISELVGLLSTTRKEDPEYLLLDAEYKELVAKRKKCLYPFYP
jgi:hypothetical protein